VQQNIYIAELENPWTMKGERVLISTPKLEKTLQASIYAGTRKWGICPGT
jgi:GH43 family beta-xylosidase